VNDFIDRFGDARFTDVSCNFDLKVNDRAGYWAKGSNDDDRVYLFNDYGLTEALMNHGLKRGVEILKKQGWLICDGDRTKNNSVCMVKKT